jgi:hypothetical protein
MMTDGKESIRNLIRIRSRELHRDL